MSWRVFKIFIGFGKTVFKAKFLGFEAEFCSIPVGGAVLATPRKREHYRIKLFAFALAGPSANAVLILAMLVAMRGRQIIVATHNPNIPVSGDAGNIMVFKPAGKKGVIER